MRSILWDESNGLAAQLAAGQVNSCCFVEGVDASGVLLQAPSVLVLYVGPSVVRYSGDSLGTEVEKLAGSSVSFDELKVGVASHVQLKVGEVSRSPASNSTGGGAGGGSSGGSGGSPPPAVLGVAFAPVSAPSQVQVPAWSRLHPSYSPTGGSRELQVGVVALVKADAGPDGCV